MSCNPCDDSTPPPAPDPVATANAQAGYDKSTALFNAQLNRFNTTTPFGSQTWTQSPSAPTRTFNQQRYDDAVKAAQGTAGTSGQYQTGNGGEGGVQSVWTPGASGTAGNAVDRNSDQFYDTTDSPGGWTQSIALNPTSQQTLESTQNNALNLSQAQGQMLANAKGAIASPINASSLPGIQSSFANNGPGFAGPVNGGDLGGLADRATHAAYDSSMALLSPQMDISRQQKVAELANRGIAQGSDAYNNEMGSLDRQQQWNRQQAANGATLTGMQYDNQLFNQGLNNAGLQNTAQQGMFNQGLAGAQFGNSANAQALQQLLSLRNQPLNEYNSMMTGTQVQTPQFQSTPSVMANAPNYQSAVGQQYQGQMNAYNAKTAADNSFMSGLMNMGSAAFLL